MIGKKHSLQNQLKPYNYHMRLPLSTDKINSSSAEDRSFNPKLKVFKMDFNSNIKSNKVATFLWPIDRWKSSPGNPNYRMQSENTKRLQRNDSERQERSQIRMTKSAIRVSNFQRSDQRINTALPGRQRQYFPFQGLNAEPSTPNISKFVVWRHKNDNSHLSLDKCQTLPSIIYK